MLIHKIRKCGSDFTVGISSRPINIFFPGFSVDDTIDVSGAGIRRRDGFAWKVATGASNGAGESAALLEGNPAIGQWIRHLVFPRLLEMDFDPSIGS